MAFDPAKFSQPITGAMSTEYEVAPEGDFVLMVGDYDEKTWFREQTFENNDGTSRDAISVSIPMEILDDNVRVQMGRERVFSRYQFFLDLDPQGNIDFSKGKNVKLGKLREVLGQNDPALPWSFPMLAGKGPFKGHNKVSSSKKNPEQKFSEISRVTTMSGN